MDKEKSIRLLNEIKEDVEALDYDVFWGYEPKLKTVRRRLSMLIDKTFNHNKYKNQLKSISFLRPSTLQGFAQSDSRKGGFIDGKRELLDLINLMIEDLKLGDMKGQLVSTPNNEKELNDKVFIVHGHNNEIKEAVARVISNIGLKPIILHEQPNKGRTIIEKFTSHSDVGFAIVILSSDDKGYSKADGKESIKSRARQNVILEMGFFLGKLGRDRVLALFEPSDDFEIPSDYDGVIYTPYDSGKAWMYELVKELKAANYDVDANDLM